VDIPEAYCYFRAVRSPVAVAVALLFVPSASAKTLTLNWVEQRSTAYYAEAMTFKVKDVTIGLRAWSVHASFTNRSQVTLRIRRTLGDYYASYDFGLGWANCTNPGGFASCGLQTLKYTYAKPVFPKQLLPRQTWSGVFGGPGIPTHGLLINVVFGVFLPPGAPQTAKEFDYITTHAFKL